MRVYVSAPIACQEQAREIGRWLETELGHSLSCRWLFIDNIGYDTDRTPESYKAAAIMDLEDVAACDMLILLAPYKSFGAPVEFGYALALGKKVLSIGPFLGVFQYHPHVTFVEMPAEDLFLAARPKLVELLFE